MTQPFRYRFVQEITGFFVLFAIFLLVAGIFFAGHAQGWFEPKLVLRTKFNPNEGTYGLQEGAEVRILGTLAGFVGPITPDGQGNMETTLILKGRFHRFVHTDSVGKIKKKFEVAGDAFVEILLGDPRGNLIEPGTYIRCEKDVELIQAAQKALDDIRAVLVPIMEQIRQGLENINRITAKIDSGTGTVGRLLNDNSAAVQFNAAVEDLHTAFAMLPNSITNIDRVVTDFKITSGNIGTASAPFSNLVAQIGLILADVRQVSAGLTGEVANIQGLLFQTRETLRETERLIQGIQQHWLLRKYVPPEHGTELLDPGAVRTRKGP